MIEISDGLVLDQFYPTIQFSECLHLWGAQLEKARRVSGGLFCRLSGEVSVSYDVGW